MLIKYDEFKRASLIRFQIDKHMQKQISKETRRRQASMTKKKCTIVKVTLLPQSVLSRRVQTCFVTRRIFSLALIVDKLQVREFDAHQGTPG